jgi:hypothetical protein
LWDEASPYGDVVYEYNGSGSTLASYVLGGTELISQTRSGITNYYLQDGQNSTRALTNSSGTVTDTYAYTAFGELFNPTGSSTNSYLYTGQQFDSLTGCTVCGMFFFLYRITRHNEQRGHLKAFEFGAQAILVIEALHIDILLR